MTATQHRRSSAEEGLIGALLVTPTAIGEIAGQLQPDDIANLRLSKVYAAMVAVWRRGIPPTVEAIADECRATGAIDDVWPEHNLVSLMAGTSSTRPERYVAAILDASLRRRVILRARQVQESASDPTVQPAVALDYARELFATIDAPTGAASEVTDVETFCAGDDSYDWLVPGLLERGDRLIVVAGEGGGKSVLLRQVAVCCAMGIHPFSVGVYGRIIDPMRVLLLDLENPTSLVRRKIRPIYTQARMARPGADSSLLGVVSRPGGIDVTTRTDSQWLQAQILAAQPDLVVAGPLYKMFVADDKWEQGARTVTSILDDLRERLGFALVLETHAPQGYGNHRHLRPIGSSIWLRWPEFGLSFVPTENHPNVVRVSMWKDRDERGFPKFMRRGGVWPWTPCRDPDGPGGSAPEENPDFEQGAF